MLIKLNIQRPGGSRIDIGGKLYHFAANKNGDHVCDVTDRQHIKRFLSIDAYEPYETEANGDHKAVRAPTSPTAPPVIVTADSDPGPAVGKQVGDDTQPPPNQDVPPGNDESMANNDTYDAMDRAALAAEIEKRTGKAPHHKTGEISLRAALRELDAAEAA